MDNEIFMYRKVCELVQSILSNANFTVETFNESVLLNYMEMLGYPIDVDKCLRDTAKDFKMHCEESDFKCIARF